ncbi:zinc finger BED domain-containing protein 5-like [Homarus americanus]|uniref:zinc finger BED domain-containing protein 5-like n=1 Tax=Homarus americanus TaxID=6706 RepID=UPI001C45F422|nr:zinc finger BED domain-containing protein 5-like [Homarus americanus]
MAASVVKKRKYNDEYINYGFTSILADGIEKPQCVLCFKVLGNDSMRPSKLKHHLTTIHPQFAERYPDFFKRHERSLGNRLDESVAFQQQNLSVVEASYEVSIEIAKKKKAYTIDETLIKPCALKMVKRVLGKASERKIQQISLSDDAVKRRISEMSDDIMKQVIQEIKSSPTGMFAVQLDESADVSSCAQLLVFVRYVFLSDIKDEYLFCTQLETTTTALDVMEKLTSFFKANGITWENFCGVCTDGAPAMLGSKSGLQKRVRENLCRGMDSEHETLLFYPKVRWLSTGNVVNRVFELRGELKLFLEMKGKDDLLSHFNEVLWEPRLVYLADIFEQLNWLNLKLQGKERNVFHHMDCIRPFIDKLQNWQRKVNAGNVAMFENLSTVLD